jgi:hypothetical protein
MRKLRHCKRSECSSSAIHPRRWRSTRAACAMSWSMRRERRIVMFVCWRVSAIIAGDDSHQPDLTECAMTTRNEPVAAKPTPPLFATMPLPVGTFLGAYSDCDPVDRNRAIKTLRADCGGGGRNGQGGDVNASDGRQPSQPDPKSAARIARPYRLPKLPVRIVAPSRNWSR